MIHTKNTFLLIFLSLLLISCGSHQQKETITDQNQTYNTQTTGDETKNQKIDKTTRKLIKKGELRFESRDAKAARQNIAELTNKYQGYMGEDKVTSYDDRIEYQLEVRIPAKSFDSFINELTSGLENIEHQDVSITDITSQYIDLEARLKSKKALEKRYLKLLDKADKVEDMLRIEEEIEKIRSDIESMQAQIKHFDRNVAYSKLQITFYEYKAQTGSITRKAGQAFIEGWKLLLKVLVGLLNIWPFLIIIGLVLFFIIRHDKKIKRNTENQQKEK